MSETPEAEQLLESLTVLAAFARTAPGMLPERVRAAVMAAAWDGTLRRELEEEYATKEAEVERLLGVERELALCQSFHAVAVGQRDTAWQEIERLRNALHVAISAPMGVVPDAALEWYDPERYPAPAGEVE